MAFARNGTAEIFYETFGDPGDETLVLVNGLGSQCINYREEWCERFVARGLHVVRMDNRDVGLSTHFSDVPSGEAAYTLSDMAADVIAVLDALGVDRAHVMGLSMGGMIVQTLAIEHPDRLRSVTSVMSTTGEPDVGQLDRRGAGSMLFGPPATDRASAIANHLEGLRIWGSPGKVDEVAQAEYAGEAFDRAFDPPGVARQIAAVMASGSRADALRNVKVPTLVLHGSADTLIDPSGGRRTAELIPGARFVAHRRDGPRLSRGVSGTSGSTSWRRTSPTASA